MDFGSRERLLATGYANPVAASVRRGRSRRPRGRATESEALTRWRAEPSAAELPELRDPALLKLLFGGDPATFAAAQRDAQPRSSPPCEAQAAHDSGAEPRGSWLAPCAGIAHEREWVRFWEELAGEST